MCQKITPLPGIPALALRMLQRAWDAGISAAWVTGDTVYGGNPQLRVALEARRQAYTLAVSCQEQVNVSDKRVRVDALIREKAQEEWHRQSAGNGAKGPRLYDWKRIELNNPELEGWQRWLVVRQSIASGSEPPDRAFFLVFAHADSTFSEMIQAIGRRWSIEQCFEVGKGEIGLDDYEVRSWHGWYRHITHCLLAQAFLTVLQMQSPRSAQRGDRRVYPCRKSESDAEQKVEPTKEGRGRWMQRKKGRKGGNWQRNQQQRP